MERIPAETNDSSHSPSQEHAAANRVAPFWSQYVEEAEKYDDAFIENNKIKVDGVLIFAGLFSAVSASFLVSFQATLQPNPSDTTNALLMMVVHSLDNSTFSGQSLGIPTWNGPAFSSVLAQVLGYAALSISLLAALGAILGKQWLGDYAASKIGSLQERGSKRQQRLDALEEWRFDAFIEILPALIQLALLLFGVSLSISLWATNKTVGYVVMSMTGLGVLFYLFVTVASLYYPTCPFRTPLSSMVQDAIGVVVMSVFEITDYWAWRLAPNHTLEPVTSQVNKTLAYLAISLPLLIILCIAPIVILVLLCCIFILAISIRNDPDFRTIVDNYRLRYLGILKENVHNTVRGLRHLAHQARDFIHWTCQDPVPDVEHATPRAVTWLLRTTTHPEKLIAALELAPAVAWPKDSNLSLLGKGPHNLFARSIPEIQSLRERALPLGKAFVILLCRMPLSVRSHGYIREEMKQLDKVIREQIAFRDFDVVFTLIIVRKLLRLRLGLEVQEYEPCPAMDVSQPLLVWLLGSLQAMLVLDPSHAKRFFPEASQLYLHLDLKRVNLSPEQQVQYSRTFETFFNFALGFGDTEVDNPEDIPAIEKEAKCLERVLTKLKTVDPLRHSDVQEHLIVTLTVLSELASTPSLRVAIRNAGINPWMLATFREAVGRAGQGESSARLLAGCVVQLAADVDAFDLDLRETFRFYRARNQPAPRIDSKSLLSYLVGEATPATSELVVYALRIMLQNEDEYFVLVSDPHFVEYILIATEPREAESIREVGLKILIATCKSLLREHDTDSFLTLADSCNLTPFVHRAILSQGQPTNLSDLLRADDEGFNRTLFQKLAPMLDDPFEAALAKLRDEPSKIPEHDLRRLETALVLSDNEGKKKYLFDHLDDHISRMASSDSRPTMTLPLTAIVGWLLRRDGPTCSSGKIDWKAFLRPNFKLLLFPAWGDLDSLGDKLQLLWLLLICTEKWLSTCRYFGPEASSQSSPAPTPELERLQRAVDQLSSGDWALPLDIKRALQKLSVEINRQDKSLGGSGSGEVRQE